MKKLCESFLNSLPIDILEKSFYVISSPYPIVDHKGMFKDI